MTRILTSQNSFNAGELTPRLFGRQDFGKYASGLETATNTQLIAQGPALRRTGFEFIAETKDSTKASKLIPFVFSASDSFILEFGDLYVRFYTNSGQVLDGGPPFEIVSVYTESEIGDLTYAQFGNQIFFAHPNHPPQVLTRVALTDWAFSELDPFPPPTVEDGFKPTTTVTPGAATGFGVTFTSSGSEFLDGDIGRQIINLSGTGRAAITALGGPAPSTTATCDIVEDFPDTSVIASGDWKLDLSPIETLTPDVSAEGSIVTLTSSNRVFRATDVGLFVLIHNGVVEITEVPTNFVAKGEILKSLDSIAATAIWTIEEEEWTASRGFPRAITLFEQRLWLAGTATRPQTIWASETGIFTAFGIGANDTDSISVDITGNDVSRINWLASIRDLIIGTGSSEATITAANTSSGITPTSIRQLPRTSYGSETQVPVTIGSEVIFIQGTKRNIRSFRFDFNIDNYTGEDLNFLAEHMTTSDLVELAYSQQPDMTLYAVMSDGDMLSATYDRSQQVVGWSRWQTNGSFESVETISSSSVDQTWVIANRTIDGATKRYVELLDIGDGSSRTDGFSDSFLVYSEPKTITGITQADPGVVTAASHGFLDGETVKLIDVGGMVEAIGKTYTVANKTATTFELSGIDTSGFTAYTSGGEAHKLVTTVSGLEHLEGETVQVKADGASHPDEVVSSGSITLDRDSFEVTVGLTYTTIIKTLRKEFNIGNGTMQGQRSRWPRPILRVYRSTIPLLDQNFLPSRSSDDLMDEAVPLFTGDLEYGPIVWSNTGQLTIELSDPLPLQLLAIYGALEGGAK